MHAAMSDNVAVVTQMPFTYDQKGFAATLEKVFFGTMHARMYMSADLWSVVCSTGLLCYIRVLFNKLCFILKACRRCCANQHLTVLAVCKHLVNIWLKTTFLHQHWYTGMWVYCIIFNFVCNLI
jgi:hypothetical protein